MTKIGNLRAGESGTVASDGRRFTVVSGTGRTARNVTVTWAEDGATGLVWHTVEVEPADAERVTIASLAAEYGVRAYVVAHKLGLGYRDADTLPADRVPDYRARLDALYPH